MLIFCVRCIGGEPDAAPAEVLMADVAEGSLSQRHSRRLHPSNARRQGEGRGPLSERVSVHCAAIC